MNVEYDGYLFVREDWNNRMLLQCSTWYLQDTELFRLQQNNCCTIDSKAYFYSIQSGFRRDYFPGFFRMRKTSCVTLCSISEAQLRSWFVPRSRWALPARSRNSSRTTKSVTQLLNKKEKRTMTFAQKFLFWDFWTIRFSSKKSFFVIVPFLEGVFFPNDCFLSSDNELMQMNVSVNIDK